MTSIALDIAEQTLRPDAARALAAWRAIVEAERDQVERLPNRPRPEDFYAPIAEAFRADPHRTDEPTLTRLLDLVRPDETWLDLGAGGGRYTLPIALKARHAYAIEPSAGMRQVLTDSAREHGIENVDIYGERWPSPVSDAPVADVGYLSQVGYDIADIGPFLDQLEAHTRRVCIDVLFDRAPISDFAPLWEPVHGEPRVLLPGLAELIALLYARGRLPRIDGFMMPRRRFESVEALHEASRRPLWVLPNTPEDERLGRAVRDLAVKHEGGFALSTRDRFVAFVSWEPRGEA
ncbi:MAG TPA: hypothetical protein VI759_07445 [Dehalococcoidia bacterium]|nr:hypothetical protein [Dehalococcoidia bacterium]